MNYEINTALEQLEKSLEDVKSAQEQVTSVTNSYGQLQVEIKQYTDSLSVISSALSSVIKSVNDFHLQGLDDLNSAWASLRTQCSAIVSDVKTLLSTTANNFKAETEQVYSNLASQVTQLETSVEKLSNLHTKVEDATTSISKLKEEITKLQSDLTNSKKAQDEAISSIDTTAKSISSQLSKSDATINGIVTTLSGQNNSLSQISQALTAVSSTLAQLSTSLQDVQSALAQRANNAQSQLGQQVASLAQNVDGNHEELKKQVSAIKIMLAVQLIVSVVIIITLFVLK